jgi:hypothetical protein
MIHTATREFELFSGSGRWLHTFAHGEVRYSFKVTPGRPAKMWAEGGCGYPHPAEGPDVEITQIEWRWHNSKAWIVADGQFGDLLAEVPDAWFLEQIEEDAA